MFAIREVHKDNRFDRVDERIGRVAEERPRIRAHSAHLDPVLLGLHQYDDTDGAHLFP